MIPNTLRLFAPNYAEPIDPATQVARLPGRDAPCLCPTTGIERIDQECLWPFCDWESHCQSLESFRKTNEEEER